MHFRYLGNSGLKISEITYGNWLTHGSQLENEQATACVHAALDAGISTFDTADVYANTKAETVLGEALQGRAARVAGDLHQGLRSDRPQGAQRRRAVAQAHHGVGRTPRCAGCRPTTSTSTRPTGTTTRRRWKRPCRPSPTWSGRGKVLYVGVSEWTAEQLRDGAALAKDLGFQLISNQPQYSALWRVIEGEVVPTSRELGISQVVWSPIAQGVLTGKYRARRAAAGRVAGHR